MPLEPTLRLGLFHPHCNGREDKFGGLASGFPADRWPRCAVCGRPQNFIAQFRHSGAVDLGQEGRTLYLFQCPDAPLCEAWDYRTGANAALLVDADDLTEDATPCPEGAEVEPEAIVVGWVPVELTPWVSCAGGSPSYGANHDESAVPPGRFLLQLVGSLDFEAPAPTPAETGAEHLHYWGGEFGQDHFRVEAATGERSHYGDWSRGQANDPGRPSQVIVREDGAWSVEWANFGSGTAYVFIDDGARQAFFFSEA